MALFHLQGVGCIHCSCVRHLGDFQVRTEAAGRTVDHRVLANGRQRLVFFGQQSAHDTCVSLDDAVIQTQAVKNAAVGVIHFRIAGIQSLLVDVKGIGVLHDEFTDPDQAEPRSGFVPVFVLDLVQVVGKVLVAAPIHGCSHRKQFFMGRSQRVGLSISVFQCEHVGIHFLADDFLDVFQDLLAHGHDHVNAVGDLFDHSRPDQQIAGDAVFITGVLPQRIKKAFTQFHGRFLTFVSKIISQVPLLCHPVIFRQTGPDRLSDCPD